MKKLILIILLFVDSIHPQGNAKDYLKQEIVKYIKKNKSNYISSGNQIWVRTDYPNWEGFEVKKFSYSAGNPFVNKETKCEAILLDPSVETIADWILTGFDKYSLNEYDLPALIKFCEYVKGQSGFQFVVRGLVDEGFGEGVFSFYDGVTVKITNFESGYRNKEEFENINFDSWLTASLEEVPKNTILRNKIRTASTTREDLINYQPEVYKKSEIGKTIYNYKTEMNTSEQDKNLLEIIRKLYKAALKSTENELYNARIKQWILENK